ncbi:MAG: PfkB family carbohydrate kinase [Desulfobacterales bacterium]|jgi:sugar/nucleoside kinase (ribokinase family)
MKGIKKGIAVVGSTTIDEIVDNGRSFLKLGGVTTYSGLTYRRHGINTLIVSNLAKQDLAILNKLYEENIVVYRGESKHTTRFVNHIEGDSRSQKLLRQAGPIQAAQIQAVLDQVDSLHLGPLHTRDIDWEAADLLQNSNRMIFLDVQGLARMQKNRQIYTSISEHMELALSIAHIVKANEAEYNAVLDFYHMRPEELMRRFNLSEIVVTQGCKGGFVQQRSGVQFNYQACIIESPSDPTGAGDVFFAAYLASRYADKKGTADACRYAARIAARQVDGRYLTADTLRLG